MSDARVREAADAYGSGDLARARRVIRQVLEDSDRDPLPWRMLGVIEAAGGDMVSARKALVRSLELEPAQSEALLELARIDLTEGRSDEAADGFRKAVETGGRPEILVRAGEGLGNLGFLGEAETCFRAALEKAPGLQAARFNLALARLAAGDAEQGRELLARVVSARPGLAPAWLHLGGALNALGRYREAMEAFQKVLELAPRDPRALAWLGASLQFLGDFEGAERHYREALQHAPDFADAHANLGKLLQGQGRSGEAEQHFRHAMRAAPGHVEALSGLAAWLDNQGRYEEALELLEQSPGVSGSYQLAPIHARVLRHLGKAPEARGLLERVTARDSLPADARIQLHFSLAAVADEQGDYGAAWRHAVEANEARRRLLPPGIPEADLAAMASAVQEIRAVFGRDAIDKLPGSGCSSERPVFIVGMPRSGKSLIEQILCSHVSVHGAGELTMLGDISSEISARAGRWPGSAPRLSGQLLQAQARRYLQALEDLAGPEILRVTDTMPFNFVHMGLIQMLFPRARIVHCVRHPMDLVLRCYFKNFAGRSLSFAFSVEDIVHYFRLYRDLMRHWASVLPSQVYTLRYESLVADPAAETAQVLEFLGLPWDPRCLRFHEPGVATSAADTPLRRPVDDREVGCWEHYREPLARFAGQLPLEEYEHGGF